MRSKSKNTTKKSLLKNSRGQAVVEYVLLILMMAIILYGIISSIAGATQKFAQNYFGAYFECLLELGELPSLGLDSSPETECDELYEPFTVTSGRPLNLALDPNGGMSSNSDSGNTDNSDSDKKNGSDSDADKTASSGSSESSGNNPIAGSGSFDTGFNGRMQKVPLSGADKNGHGAGGDDQGVLNGTNNFKQNDFGTDGSGRSEYVPIYGTATREDEEQKNANTVKADVAANPEQALRGKRVPVSVGKPVDENLKKDEGLAFPDFIRILIIAAIVLIILIFFGGQVMQYNKSQD